MKQPLLTSQPIVGLH